MSLQIDFAPSAKSQSPLRLGIGSIMLAVTLGLAWSLTSETEAGLLPTHTQMPAAEEIRSINSAIDDLNFPWLAVLNSIESSADNSLRFLQLDADAHDSRMSIQGEARNSKAVLELPARLRSNTVIAEARVVSQSPASNGETRDFPVRFALEVMLQTTAETQP
jgi:hypothetical protein